MAQINVNQLVINNLKKIFKMKTYIISILLLLTAFLTINVQAQDNSTAQIQQKEKKEKQPLPEDFCPHRIHTYLGSGYTNPMYLGVKQSFIHNNYSIGSVVELKYAYFFTPNWGLSIGAGISHYAAKSTLNFEGEILNYNDPEFDQLTGHTYDLRYKGNDLIENQTIWGMEVPLQAHFEYKLPNNHGIFASLGVKGYFPFMLAQSTFPVGDGKLITKGYEQFTNTLYEDVPGRFGERDARTTPAKVKMRHSVDITAEFGGIMQIAQNCDFYLGVYGSYGFLDILPKDANKTDFITNEPDNVFSVNSLLGSKFLKEYNQSIDNGVLDAKKVNEKWNRWQVGLKIGFHIKPCAKLSGKSTSDALEREFYREVPKKLDKIADCNGKNNTIVIRDTVQAVYIYNIPPSNYLDDPSLTKEEKENITNLSSVLQNTKILFDLDKDIPKISNRNAITQSAKILMKDQSLGLIIEGYTCDLGSEAHNRDLAARRAESVRQLFIQDGVKPEQIRVAAYTFYDKESKVNIPDENREEHRAVIFRIVKNK
jgi:outer membrane protein OmpA-like peptidoglycan-associated protein